MAQVKTDLNSVDISENSVINTSLLVLLISRYNLHTLGMWDSSRLPLAVFCVKRFLIYV